MTNVLK